MFVGDSDQYCFWSQRGHKAFWITDSERLSGQAKIIIREHQLLRDSCNYSQDLLQGMIKIQNCGFIIEATSAECCELSGIQVALPVISEAFTNELLTI